MIHIAEQIRKFDRRHNISGNHPHNLHSPANEIAAAILMMLLVACILVIGLAQ